VDETLTDTTATTAAAAAAATTTTTTTTSEPGQLVPLESSSTCSRREWVFMGQLSFLPPSRQCQSTE